MKREQQKQQDNSIDPEGLKRIQDMIKGVVKPVQPPAKEYQMPKGDTATVARMKAEIAAKKARKDKHTVNPEVVNEKPSIDNHMDNQEVVTDIKERVLIDMYVSCLSKELRSYLVDLTELELRSTLSQLQARCQADGVGMPTNEALVEAVLVLHADNLINANAV